MRKTENIPSDDIFKVDDKTGNLMAARHLGIFNGKMTIATPSNDVLQFQMLIAPPYVSSGDNDTMWNNPDTILQGRCFGERVKTTKYVWHPFMLEREGTINAVKVRNRTVLIDGLRVVLVMLDMENRRDTKIQAPLQFQIKGGLDYVDHYGFVWPEGKTGCAISCQGNRIIMENVYGAVVVMSNMNGFVWHGYSSIWETMVNLPAHGKKNFCLCISIGAKAEAVASCERVLKGWESEYERTRKAWRGKVADLFSRIPVLESDNRDLIRFYNRSLLPFLFNRWEVDDFVINPYYSTGGVNGGCIGSYLWDYGNPSKMWALYDPASAKNQLKQFLSGDLTVHNAFSPGKGEAHGPWYPINQENIIALIYYYVLISGNFAFLRETINGKTVLDWVFFHATYRDELSKDAVLIDYGTGNNHLELRKQHRYDNYIPDLNARRCLSYKRAYDLCRLIGQKPPVDFIKRAQDLKPLIKAKLWDQKEQWFAWLGEDQKRRELRYTYLIYEMFATGALDREEEQGLLSHLNDREFLSDYGLHSISKKDPAYDQVDIDNGGGGACTCIETTIIERLYKAGYSSAAEEIFKRILWWGTRLPYMTDSQVTNYMAAREDSPLQNAVGALAGAQCIIWGLFGVEINDDFDLMINPRPTTLAKTISLKGLKIRDKEIDISVRGKIFELKVNGVKSRHKTGTRVKVCELTNHGKAV